MWHRLLFTIIPKIYWITIFSGILLRFSDNFISLSNIILNLAIALIFIKISIIIHEIGHLVCAKIAGGKPQRMILGKGHEIIRFRIFKIKIIIKKVLKGGFAMASFYKLDNLKLRYFVYIIGGVLFNFLAALSAYMLFDFDWRTLGDKDHINAATSFIFVNTGAGLLNLIPFQIKNMGIIIPSDGLSLLKLPFKKIDQVKKDIDASELFDAFEYYELKEYDKAITIYEKHIMNAENTFFIRLNLSVMYLKKGEFDKSYLLLRELKEELHDKKYKPYRALVNNNIAWVYLLKGKITEADLCSKTAIAIDANEIHFQGTRGAILIEKGEVKKGIKMLTSLIDLKLPNNITLSTAMSLYSGYTTLGDLDKAKKYKDFVEKNTSLLAADDEQYWRIICHKT